MNYSQELLLCIHLDTLLYVSLMKSQCIINSGSINVSTNHRTALQVVECKAVFGLDKISFKGLHWLSSRLL